MAYKREFMQKLKTTHYETWNVSKISFTETLRIMNITTKCIQLQTNQPNSMGLQKHINKDIDAINIQSLNFRPIIAQTRTCTYNAAQVISNSLKPLYTCNELMSQFWFIQSINTFNTFTVKLTENRIKQFVCLYSVIFISFFLGAGSFTRRLWYIFFKHNLLFREKRNSFIKVCVGSWRWILKLES